MNLSHTALKAANYISQTSRYATVSEVSFSWIFLPSPYFSSCSAIFPYQGFLHQIASSCFEVLTNTKRAKVSSSAVVTCWAANLLQNLRWYHVRQLCRILRDASNQI